MTVSSGPAYELPIVLAVASSETNVTVNGEAGLLYAADLVSSATKTDTPVREIPLSVQVVPNQVLQDQQAIRLQDATKNVSGVQANFGYGGLYEAFALRGFETNVTQRRAGVRRYRPEQR